MAFLLMTVLISYEVMKVGNLSPTTGLFLIIPVNNLPNWINVRCRPFSNCWTGLNVIWNFLSNTRIKNCCSFNPVLVSEQTFVKVSFYDDCAQREPQEVMCCCKFTISKGSAWSNCVSNCKIQRQFCVRDREREREHKRGEGELLLVQTLHIASFIQTLLRYVTSHSATITFCAARGRKIVSLLPELWRSLRAILCDEVQKDNKSHLLYSELNSLKGIFELK